MTGPLQAVDSEWTEPEARAPRGTDAPPRSVQRARELRELLETRRGEHHIVAIQDFPDPDAISSALAYREIARGFDIDVDIVYDGMISHPENLALVNLLEIEITRYTPDLDLDRYQGSVFVDTQGTTTRMTPRLRDAGVPPLIVIDHHDAQDLLDPVFHDIRPVGAAATLLTEYLRSGVFLEMERAIPTHEQLATALMHGLHSETDSFVRAGRAEFSAAAYLCRFTDAELLERVLCVQKTRGVMDTIQTALACRTIRGGLSLAGVGYVRWSDRDAIPQAADFLLTEENVHTAIVYGLVRREDGRDIISGSLRTNNATLGVDAFLKRALGQDPQGRPYGGGRSRAGGFEIELGFLSDGPEEREQTDAKWTLYDRRIRKKMFYAAGLEDEPAEGKPRPRGGNGVTLRIPVDADPPPAFEDD